MGAPLVALCAIVKDEAHSIVKTLESCEGIIDFFVVLDTGSTDGTLDAVRAWRSVGICGDCGEASDTRRRCVIAPAVPFDDYASARNRVLDAHLKLPQPATWSLSLSADEVLRERERGALRAFLEAAPPDESALLVEVRTDAESFPYPRLLRTGSPWRYEGEIHEQPVHQTDRARRATVTVPGVWIEHRATDPERRARRLRDADVPLLEKMLARSEAPADRARTAILLAQAHEAIASGCPDVASASAHQFAALGRYALVAHDDVAPEEARRRARWKYLNVAETIGVYTSGEMVARLAPICAGKDAEPAALYMMANHLSQLDAHEGLQAAYRAAKAARDAAADPARPRDPHGLQWRAHLIAAACAKVLGHVPAARKSAEAGIAAGGPPEAFREFLGAPH